MDKITHEVRLTRWTRLVEQCQSRPEGQTIAQWCKEAGIGEKTYYWQRRVRLHCAAQIAGELPATRTESNEVSFAEVKFTEELFRMLMVGLNPLEPRIMEVYPEKVC